jgi:hypothetical protein
MIFDYYNFQLFSVKWELFLDDLNEGGYAQNVGNSQSRLELTYFLVLYLLLSIFSTYLLKDRPL